MKNLKFEMGPHSADKDHTIMTGGTLKLDKKVSSDEPLTIYHYILPAVKDVSINNLHQGIHTLEHMLAYSVDTGSLRAGITKIISDENIGKSVLDISPYLLAQNYISYRVSSVSDIGTKLLTEAYKFSLQTGKKYLESGGIPPFATPRQCGQYDFHDSNAALEIIGLAQKQLDEGEVAKPILISDSKSKDYIVCDLRLIKPKREGVHEQRTLKPDSSYTISQKLEESSYKALPSGEFGDIRFGTFGCMTGDYVMSKSKYSVNQIHIAITRGLMTLLNKYSNDPTQADLREDVLFCLDHIKDNSSSIYLKAQELGQIL